MPTDDTQQPVPRSLALATIAGVTSIQVFATMAAMIPPSIAPKLAEALDLPVSMIGFQVSFAYVGATLMSLATGLVVRKFGAVRTNQVAAVLLALSLLTMAVPHIAALAVGSFGIGFAYGLTNPAASHLMMKIATPANRNLIFSVKQTGQPLGGVVAGLMAPPIAVLFGWQWALVAGAVLALCGALAIQPLRRRMDADRDPKTRFRGAVFHDLKLVARTKPLRMLALAGLSFSAVQLALMTFAVTMLVEDVKLDLVTAGTCLAVLQVAGVLGRLGWGVIADRCRNGRLILLISQMLSIAAALLTALLSDGSSLMMVYVVLALFGVSAIGWNGVFMAELASNAPPGRIGNATGGVLVPVFIGVILGPMLFTGIHAVVESYTVGFAVMAAVTVMGLAFVFSLPARRTG